MITVFIIIMYRKTFKVVFKPLGGAIGARNKNG